MPDAFGRFLGISVPAEAWERVFGGSNDPPRAASKHEWQPLCFTCMGYGWLRVWIGGTERSHVTCDACKGTGHAR